MFENFSVFLSMLTTDFHWLRPLWLLSIPILGIALYVLWNKQSKQSGWKSLINADLLPHLLQGERQGESQGINRLPILGLALLWLIGALAMAGPSWEKIPQPIHKSEQAMVILLDLSPSMLAEDVKPSRMTRAQLKLIDFLKQRKEGLTALIAYAGEAHTITPLTDDTQTIVSLAPSLTPSIMPLSGSNPEMAIDLALSLFTDAGINQGDIVLITDGVATAAANYINKHLPSEYRLSILGVGTDKGAPIPASKGGFAKDSRGNIVLARLDSATLYNLTTSTGGHYQTLTATDADIKSLAKATENINQQQTRQVDRQFDLWLDRGPWLLLPLLPLILLSFRRGWLLTIALVVLLPLPKTAQAAETETSYWQNLWQTPDQQGKALLEQGNASGAAQKFDNKQWAGSAHYQANEFEQAIESFSNDDSAIAHYNRGNALAKSNKLAEASEAYETALEKNANLADAQFNKDLVDKLIQEQQKQQKQQDQQDQQDQKNEDSKDSDQDQSSDDSDQQQSEQDSKQEQSDSEQQENQENSESESSDNNQSSDSKEPPQEQTEPEESEEQKQDPEQQESDAEPQTDAESQPAQASKNESPPLTNEQQQALEQWLRKIPDDPSGLMRKKFEHQYYQRRQQYKDGTWKPPENDAINRW